MTPPANGLHPTGSEADGFPASFAQELLFLIDRASSGSNAYNVPRTLRLTGSLDLGALRRALDALVLRHEILRTTYTAGATGVVQLVHPARAVPLVVEDLRARPAPEADADALVRASAARPFDLTRDLLVRAALLRTADDEHILHVDTHHIATDGWSRGIFYRDLDELYAALGEGRAANLPALPIQYADYSVWQREELQGERLERLLTYWRGELGGIDATLDVPSDRPLQLPSLSATTHSIVLPPGLAEDLKRLGRSYAATPYMTLLAAYMVVLQRYSGAADVLVGSPSAGRARPETQNLIGNFLNTLVQRGRFTDDPTFADLLTQVRESCLGAYEHEELPFEKLVLEAQPANRRLGETPFVRAVLTMIEDGEGPASRLGPLGARPYGSDLGTTKFDLTLFMADGPVGMRLGLRVRSSVWGAATAQRFLQHLRCVIEGAVAGPARRVSTLPLLEPHEDAWLSAQNPATVDLGAPLSICALIDAAAARVPGRVAVVADDAVLTYAELSARAVNVAARLRKLGVGANACVGILLDRSAASMVALLGILKSGGAYVPLSPDAPAARLEQQLSEARITVAVTAAAYVKLLPPSVKTVRLDREAAVEEAHVEEVPLLSREAAAADSLAYVLFTSGSTGVPKGVAVTHGNIVQYTRAISRVLGDVPAAASGDGLAALDGWHFLTVGPLSADLGNTALFPALCGGGTLHLMSAENANDADRFAAYLASQRIDVLKVTPGHLRALLAGAGAERPALPSRWLVVGGEALPFEFAEQLCAPGACRVLNHYGPTETTVGACTFEVTRAALADAREAGARTVPIGAPLANVRCEVLDAHGRRVPAGVHGELCIGGDGVARGYLGRDELTTERFFRHPAYGRMYRTGDRVRRLTNGALEFLGRADGQVKIRGHRVEVGDVEAMLVAHSRVRQAVVRAWDEGGDAHLAAYVVRSRAPAGGREEDEAELREFLAARLPAYMQPRTIVFLDALPLSANGKVDRQALPPPEVPIEGAGAAVPSSPSETALAEIWTEAFRLQPGSVGRTSNFILLGGHSLLAIRILGKIKRRLGVRLPLRAIFDAPALAELAEVIDLQAQLDAIDGLSEEEAANLLTSDADVGALR